MPFYDPIVVHIQPVDTALINYLVYLGPTLLLGPTPTPYIDSANLLLAQGYNPARKFIMRRRGVDVNQMSYPLVWAGQLRTENQANPPNPPYPSNPF